MVAVQRKIIVVVDILIRMHGGPFFLIGCCRSVVLRMICSSTILICIIAGSISATIT